MLITEADREWLKANHPRLTIQNGETELTIEGDFEFNAAYDESRREYVVNPSAKHQTELICIQDRYRIRITIPKDTSLSPVVDELDGRIESVAKARKSSLRDLHIYEGGRTCLVGHLDLLPLNTLPEFIDRAVLQYFYDQSCFERFGWWPRGTYSHGLLGLLENYIDHIDRGEVGLEEKSIQFLLAYPQDGDFKRIVSYLLLKSKVGGHLNCVCNSGKALRHCQGHDRVFRGLWQLQQYVRQDNKISKLLSTTLQSAR